MKTLTIAGVPEHFNLPWHLAIEQGHFENEGIQINWIDVPEGTGKMCQMLRNGETDIAVILTEGIVKDIEAGNPSSIVQVYVESPLLWGIHVAAGSPYQTVVDLQNSKVAISRYGSGSHLMACVQAQQLGWDSSQLTFTVVNTIEGAVASLNQGTADYFMWERFMTQPLVDQGIFRRIGECPTPWPCFVIAVRNSVLENDKATIARLLKVINDVTTSFKQCQGIEQILANRHQLQYADVEQWLAVTEWSQSNLSESTVTQIQNRLFELNLIDKKSNFTTLVTQV
ncbi:substrate-binding domain-containing protein [Flavobacterium sp.]|uniref:substrate-binding domain-containing protein n=1 Tax=Flavobacterium sp. TaxID=239 RepID=UPI0026112B0F|nr:substrate-binding domain-containing protein [Flavobacterium sp.]